MAQGTPCSATCKLCQERILEPAPMSAAEAAAVRTAYEAQRRAYDAEYRAAHAYEGAAAFSHDRLI